MKDFNRPTNKQATSTDGIGPITLLDDIFVEDSRQYYIIIVSFQVVEYDDITAKFRSDHH